MGMALRGRVRERREERRQRGGEITLSHYITNSRDSILSKHLS